MQGHKTTIIKGSQLGLRGKTDIIRVRVTGLEKRAISARATALDISLSEYMRSLAREDNPALVRLHKCGKPIR